MAPHPAADDPARPVADMVHSVDELGANTGRLFGRLYNALRRKQHAEAAATASATADIAPAARQLAQLELDQLKQLTRNQQTSIARLTGILAQISEGVIMQDPEGRIVLMNEAARQLLGSVRTFWSSELGRMFSAARTQINIDGEITLQDARRVEVNDRVIGAQLAIVTEENGAALGTVLMLRDVTADALADRLKDQFITQMSHELRTPLAAIKGMSDVLLAMPEDRAPNRKFLEAISRNVAVLDRMIVELLDISEIGAGSFAVRGHDVSMAELVFIVIQGLKPDFEKAEIDLAVMVSNRDKLTVKGDDRRLKWAVRHLLDNSLKYTEPGGEIVLRLGRIREEHILIEVSDTGVGIHPNDLPHIFERFYRGEARDSQNKLIDPRGLGQGLFVARAVAEAHGGYLSVASVVGEGSTFTLALPVNGHAYSPTDELPPPTQIAPPE